MFFLKRHTLLNMDRNSAHKKSVNSVIYLSSFQTFMTFFSMRKQKNIKKMFQLSIQLSAHC